MWRRKFECGEGGLNMEKQYQWTCTDIELLQQIEPSFLLSLLLSHCVTKEMLQTIALLPTTDHRSTVLVTQGLRGRRRERERGREKEREEEEEEKRQRSRGE